MKVGDKIEMEIVKISEGKDKLKRARLENKKLVKGGATVIINEETSDTSNSEIVHLEAKQ